MITELHILAMGHILACRQAEWIEELLTRRPFWARVFAAYLAMNPGAVE